MQLIDWLIVCACLMISLGLGLAIPRKATTNWVDFFIAGRRLPPWLAGVSMAAIGNPIEMPLYLAGVVGNQGIAGVWPFWSLGVGQVVLIYLLARLWRRAQVGTDAELTELRYGGQPAAMLRGVKAGLLAVPICCLGIGYALLIAVKIGSALGLWQSLGLGANAPLISMVGVSGLVLIYTAFSGMWGVVASQCFQFFLASFGGIVVAAVALKTVGGMSALTTALPATGQTTDQTHLLQFMPFGGMTGLDWRSLWVLPTAACWANLWLPGLGLGGDGSGLIAQRLLATNRETDAGKGVWWFTLLTYGVRTWPGIVVALVALVRYPDLADRALGYPMLILDTLPPAILGLAVASLLAAFMGTVSALINGGAAYLSHDLYGRFLKPQATQAELVQVGRLSAVLVTIGGAAIALIFSQDPTSILRWVVAIATGPGLVLILRWFWWRINAYTELAAILSGWGLALIGLFWKVEDSWGILALTTAVITVIWLGVMYLTPPESDATLDRFYQQVRPGGPGWQRQRQRTQVYPLQNLSLEGQRILAALLFLFGLIFALGGFLFLRSLTGWLALVTAVLGGWWLRTLERQPPLPMPRPGLEDNDIL